jgi:hypothetical protein
MLGQVDQDDPTNLPPGCAAVCLNTDFTRDASGIVPWTRAGNCMIMQGAKSPGTGFWDFQYEPESATDPFFQMPLLFHLNGVLEREYPVGTGRMVAVENGMFTLPTDSHKIDCQAANGVQSAYSDLDQPTAGLSWFNPKTLNLDPLGMKPYGWRWLPSTFVYAGEVCTPSNSSAGPFGNGHTYQAQNSGWTGGGAEPVWPLTEGWTVAEQNVAAGETPVTWKELTMVIANRLPAPPVPTVTATAGGGTWTTGDDIYAVVTLINGMGESLPSSAGMISNLAAAATPNVKVAALADLPGWISQLVTPYAVTGVNVYMAAVAHGAAAPPLSAYQRANSSPVALGSTTPFAAPPVSDIAPPTLCSARITPGQLPTPDSEPVLVRDPGAGAFPADRDVYVALAYGNANGSTPIGPVNSIVNTIASDAVQVDLSQPAEYPQLTEILVYEADVPTGSAPPPSSAYSLVGVFAPTATVTITESATGSNPPTANSTGPGGNIAADTSDGGVNGTQGYRYAVPCWINRNETFSGFEQAAVSQYDVDEDGWEIAVFNVPVGPANIIGRAINWTTVDSTSAGGFWWIGLVNLQVPTQNQVYPNSFLSDGIAITPTVLLDNVTTSATFNFTDEYLQSDNNTTDRLRVKAPPQGLRGDYLTTCDRLAVSGVPGYAGPWISLGADYESFYGDTSPVPIPTTRGEREWGCIEFRNQIYVMRSQSAFVVVPGTGDPASWDVRQRWGPTPDSEGVGPCGPRAFAACPQFIIFVHRTGVYRYDGTAAPDLMTKEIPRMWAWINWAAAETIDVTIDPDTHTVRIQVPVGNSTIPNKEYCLSYLEGWLNPIHFSTFAQKEISQEAARRWSFNDFSAFICRRIQRTVPNPPVLPGGPDGTVQLTSDYYISQLAYTSAVGDGLVNARTPGRYDDNGAGIDWKYQTTSAQDMQRPCKPEGVVTSANLNGAINVSFIAGRKPITSQGGVKRQLKCPPMQGAWNGNVDYTRKPNRALDEYWSVLYDNGKVPGVACSLKKATVYVIPVKVARGMLDTQQ